MIRGSTFKEKRVEWSHRKAKRFVAHAIQFRNLLDRQLIDPSIMDTPGLREHQTLLTTIRTFNSTPPTIPRERMGILIDTGAIVNLHSDYWRRRFAKCLSAHGLRAHSKPKEAAFSGIGGKTETSKEVFKLPISIDGLHGNFVSQELSSSSVPAILGLNGIEKNEMMIIPHDERVIVPNGGKIRITVTKEVRIIKCIRTVSGHLLLPCDNFDKEDEGQTSTMTLFEGNME